jgi:hypothetical protein
MGALKSSSKEFFGSPVLSGDMPYTYTRYSVPQITVGCIRWRFPEKTGEPVFRSTSRFVTDNGLFHYQFCPCVSYKS